MVDATGPHPSLSPNPKPAPLVPHFHILGAAASDSALCSGPVTARPHLLPGLGLLLAPFSALQGHLGQGSSFWVAPARGNWAGVCGGVLSWWLFQAPFLE